jgi:hypothetical protein
VSNDTSRSSGYQLGNQDRAGGGPGGTSSGSRELPDPPWIKVIGTTIRLWLRRRVLRVPDSGRIGTRHLGRIAAVLAAVLVVAGGAVAITLTVHAHADGSHSQSSAIRLKRIRAQTIARAAAAAAAQANGEAAARWIAAQAGHGLVIGCDQATCAAIQAAGYPTGGQVVLQPGVRLPGPGSLIVVTPAVHAQYGARLSIVAPAVIASFGAGAQAVRIAVVVPGGQQAYSRAARKALAARRRAGRMLLQDSKVHARGAVRTDLRSGRVDPRLIIALRRLAARYAVHVVHFGDAGPQAGRAVPFRMAEVAAAGSGSGRRADGNLRGMEKLLKSEPARYRAKLLQRRLAGGAAVLEIKFLAPSPV